jgi:hypothetical protein
MVHIIELTSPKHRTPFLQLMEGQPSRVTERPFQRVLVTRQAAEAPTNQLFEPTREQSACAVY